MSTQIHRKDGVNYIIHDGATYVDKLILPSVLAAQELARSALHSYKASKGETTQERVYQHKLKMNAYKRYVHWRSVQ